MSVVFITPSNEFRVEYKIIKGIYLKCRENDYNVEFRASNSIFGFFSCVYSIFISKVVVFHSALLISFPLLLIARVLNKKIVLFVWDSYPVIIGGRRFDSSFKRRLFDIIENIAISMSNLIFVPSDDFLNISNKNKVKVRNFWHCDGLCKRLENKEVNQKGKFRIIFAGQVNEIRDLESAFFKLKPYFSSVDFELVIASSSEISRSLLSQPEVKYIGCVEPLELKEIYNKCHFGLVSLNLNLTTDAFPSKTFEYISSGLPILYHGPINTSFSDLLISTHIGLNVGLSEGFDIGNYNFIINDFESHANEFISKTCLDSNAIISIFEDINR